MSETISALQLPLAEQKRIAKDVFNMSHADWVQKMSKSDKECKRFLHKIQNHELEDTHMTPEEIKHFQAKMNSGNPR